MWRELIFIEAWVLKELPRDDNTAVVFCLKLVYGKRWGLTERFWSETDVDLNPTPPHQLGGISHILNLSDILLSHLWSQMTSFTSTKTLSLVSASPGAFLFCWGRWLVSKYLLLWLWKPQSSYRRPGNLVWRSRVLALFSVPSPVTMTTGKSSSVISTFT